MARLFRLMVGAGMLFGILLIIIYSAKNHDHTREDCYSVDECVDACLYATRECTCR